MKVAILAGGVGTRLVEETEIRPKPMVEIGGRPILWHIMMHYASYGFREFYIALGYKGEYIKKYFVELASLHSDLSVNLRTGHIQRHGTRAARLGRPPDRHGHRHAHRPHWRGAG